MFDFNVCTVHEQILVLLYDKIGHRSKGDTVLCGHITSKYRRQKAYRGLRSL